MNTKVLLIYTGGTIGMVKDYDSQTLNPFDFDNLLQKIPEINLIDCEIEYKSFDEPIDSSDMKPDHWILLVELIHDNYSDYDGFVVLHGTDTMAYTASACSFMLKNLKKPVVFTGSQLPIGDLRTDAKENLITSIHFASLQKDGKAVLNEVLIYFDNKLFRANRTTKINAENFNAFDSPNFPRVGLSGVHIDVKKLLLLKGKEEGVFSINTRLNTDVGLLKIYPGMKKEYVEAVLNIQPMKALILEAFGTGNIFTDKWFLDLLKEKVDNGLLLIVNTQCSGGKVELGRYKTSSPLVKIGAVTSHDMTMEAGITKAIFLLGQGYTNEVFRQKYEKSLRGELTPWG